MASSRSISVPRTADYSAHLAEEMISLNTHHTLTDFTIYSGKNSFSCHKFILAANSPVLKAMLNTDMKETSQAEMRMNNIPVPVMEIILNFMYSGDLNLEMSELMGTLEAAEYLQMKVLKRVCLDQVPGSLCPENAISWMKAAERMDLAEIRSQCTQVVVSAISDITEQEEFLTLSPTEVKDFFNATQDQEMDDEELLKAAMKWVSFKMESRIEHLDQLLQQISLEECSSDVLWEQAQIHSAILDVRPALYMMFFGAAMGGGAEKQTKSKKKSVKRNQQEVLALIGGIDRNNDMNRSCWYVDKKTHQMIKLTEIPYDCGNRWHSVCKTAEGFAVTGGEDSEACAMFVTATRTWRKLHNMPGKRQQHGSICMKNQLYVLGGNVNGQPTGRVDYLDAVSDCWHPGPELPRNVNWPKVASIKNSIYLLDQDTGDLLQHDVGSTDWCCREPLPQGQCWGVSMAAAGETLCVVGGFTTVCFWYQPATNTWSAGRNKPSVRHSYGALIHFQEKLYLLGGSNFGDVYEVEEYDADSQCWSVSSVRMPMSLWRHHAMVLDIKE